MRRVENCFGMIWWEMIKIANLPVNKFQISKIFCWSIWCASFGLLVLQSYLLFTENHWARFEEIFPAQNLVKVMNNVSTSLGCHCQVNQYFATLCAQLQVDLFIKQQLSYTFTCQWHSNNVKTLIFAFSNTCVKLHETLQIHLFREDMMRQCKRVW